MHPHFYRVKAAALAWEIAQTKAATAVRDAKRAFEVELTACGLDPTQTYQLDEATQAITDVPSPAGGRA